jgi:hypothetical protein
MNIKTEERNNTVKRSIIKYELCKLYNKECVDRFVVQIPDNSVEYQYNKLIMYISMILGDEPFELLPANRRRAFVALNHRVYSNENIPVFAPSLKDPHLIDTLVTYISVGDNMTLADYNHKFPGKHLSDFEPVN